MPKLKSGRSKEIYATPMQARFILASTQMVVWMDDRAVGRTTGGLLAMLVAAHRQGKKRWLVCVNSRMAIDRLWATAQTVRDWTRAVRPERWTHAGSGLELTVVATPDTVQRCRGMQFDGVWFDDVWDLEMVHEAEYFLSWHTRQVYYRVTAERDYYPLWMAQWCGIPSNVDIPWTPLPLPPNPYLTLIMPPRDPLMSPRQSIGALTHA